MERNLGAAVTYLFLQFFQVPLLKLQFVLQFSDSLKYTRLCVRKSTFSRFNTSVFIYLFLLWSSTEAVKHTNTVGSLVSSDMCTSPCHHRPKQDRERPSSQKALVPRLNSSPAKEFCSDFCR